MPNVAMHSERTEAAIDVWRQASEAVMGRTAHRDRAPYDLTTRSRASTCDLLDRFCRRHTEAECLGALTRMIGGYSVAWLVDDGEALAHPVVAVVSIFDGDGFALVARSQTSMRSLRPDIPIPVLH